MKNSQQTLDTVEIVLKNLLDDGYTPGEIMTVAVVLAAAGSDAAGKDRAGAADTIRDLFKTCPRMFEVETGTLQ